METSITRIHTYIRKCTICQEDPQGEFALREHISIYLYHSRGVHSSPDQIVIGAGTQPLLWLLLQLLGPTKEYGIENPGFHRIHAIIKSCDRQIHPIPLDEKGIDISSLYNTNSNVAYVTPSHQFPLGIIMPLSRRLELLKWANDCNGYIIEDDYDGEFRYAGKPIPSLQSLDSNERVFIWELSQNLFTFFTNGICCFTTTPFKDIPRTAWNFQTNSRYNTKTCFC